MVQDSRHRYAVVVYFTDVASWNCFSWPASAIMTGRIQTTALIK